MSACDFVKARTLREQCPFLNWRNLFLGHLRSPTNFLTHEKRAYYRLVLNFRHWHYFLHSQDDFLMQLRGKCIYSPWASSFWGEWSDFFYFWCNAKVRLTLTSDRSDLEGGPSLWRTEEGDKHRSLKFRAICSGAYFAAQGLRVSWIALNYLSNKILRFVIVRHGTLQATLCKVPMLHSWPHAGFKWNSQRGQVPAEEDLRNHN